jgi:nucleoid-associated protein YgaU
MKRYTDIQERLSNSGKRYKVNPIYPSIPLSENDTYVITVGGDRYDTLAHEFYNDSRLWWIIASANNADRDTINITPGTQLRIPSEVTQILESYESFNANR